jgi:hypothetical protein
MKAGGGSGILEKNRSRRGVEKRKEKGPVEYSVVSCKLVVAFIVIFGMWRRKSV